MATMVRVRMIVANAPGALTWSTVAIILGSVAAIVLVIWVIGKLVPGSKKYASAGGNALMRAETFFRPSREHVIEAKEHEEKEEDASRRPA